MNSELTLEQDCTAREQWKSFVVHHPAASNYHQYGWRDVIERSFKHRCFYSVVKDSAGDIVGLLPLVFMQSRLFGRFLVSLPFVNYGGLLCDRQDVGDLLLAGAAALQKELKAGYVEIRHCQGRPGGMPTKQKKVAMILHLATNAEEQWQGFNAKLRNQIRKAEKNDLGARLGGEELLPEFYKVFAHNMRDLGTPVYGREFFSEVLTAFPNQTRILAVSHKGKTIAAGMLSCFHDTVEIPWASSMRAYNSLCPNNLLYWKALQFALSEGFTRFDFGRSSPGEGTYKFKQQWGAKPIQLNWQYILPEGASMPQLNTKNPKYEMAIKLWRKLPLSVTKILGPHIVKYIP